MDRENEGNKRKRSASPPPWRKHNDSTRYRERDAPRSREGGQQQRWSHKEQMKLNQLQEDERMREWVAQEDEFVLKQAKKKAQIRIKEGRAKPIDWLAITLRVVDPTKDLLDDDIEDKDLEFVDPDSVFDGLSETQLSDLQKDIDTYFNLESNRKNRDYWKTMQIICKDRQKKLRALGPEGRAVGSVQSDIDKLLGPKTYEQLEALEKQIQTKLDSNEPIDTDYWQQLLDSLLVWKAKAKIKKVYRDVLDSRLKELREENERNALAAREHLGVADTQISECPPEYEKRLDPDPLLEIAPKDKTLEAMDEDTFLRRVATSRRKIHNMGYVPSPKQSNAPPKYSGQAHSLAKPSSDPTARFDTTDDSATTKTLFDREAAKGVGEDEEIFANEEDVSAATAPSWMGKYRPRKPKYFNRVLLGYEWNKYNQTHYSADNPPPRVVQGYKFHIFYPELIDATKAPTYRIMREGGRKKGQTMAPAGEEDTCIIRFMAGPPYEDVAFRVVDRDWDYSAKGERGFKSTFERGILSLHFTFKRVVYRK